MQIVIDIPNSDISLKQNVITLDLHFIDGHICECTYPFKELPKKHGRLIDANKLEAMMYHEAFEIDSDMQKWDSGCWIRYKVFENCMNRLLPDTILEAEE
jgi:hypothetical protein